MPLAISINKAKFTKATWSRVPFSPAKSFFAGVLDCVRLHPSGFSALNQAESAWPSRTEHQVVAQRDGTKCV